MPLRRLVRPTSSLLASAQRITAIHSHLRPVALGHLQQHRAMADIPKTMRGVAISTPGGVDVLDLKSDLPVPEPQEGQVLVKNDFIGVNFIDTYFRSGLYKAPKLPLILGKEAEGTVVKVGSGEVHGLQVGDRVAYLGDHTYAEYSAAPAWKTVKIPSGLPPQIAAAAMIQGLTALTLIREAHAVQTGDWILVHAAAGGTGLWLCQLLRAVGAKVIGTASTADKTELAQRAGAQHVVNYTTEDVRARVLELTGGEGVAAVFDGVGNATFELSMACVARKGSMVSFGSASGAVAPFTVARLGEKNVRLLRPVVFNYIATRAEFEHYAAELLRLLGDGAVDVRVHAVYPLSQVAAAHRDLEGRKTTGKLLLDPSK